MIVAALILLAAAAAAVLMRNLIRATLALALAFAALGAVFVILGAEFAGLVQILVNVGAVAVLIAFVVLITRPDRIAVGVPSGRPWIGVLCALIVGGILCAAVMRDGTPARPAQARGSRTSAAPVAEIGAQLVNEYLIPFQMIAVLLTAALVGAGLLAADEIRKEKP